MILDGEHLDLREKELPSSMDEISWMDAFTRRRGTISMPGSELEWPETPGWHGISGDEVLGGEQRLGKKKWLDSPSA